MMAKATEEIDKSDCSSVHLCGFYMIVMIVNALNVHETLSESI